MTETRPKELTFITLERCRALGDLADKEFRATCFWLGLDYKIAISAPLEYVALAMGRIQ